MHSHQQYAANLVKRTTAADIFEQAWTEPEAEPEADGTGRRRRRPGTEAQEAAGLRELHDVVMLYGGDPKGPTVQAWGAKLAGAADFDRGTRPITWALVLAPLLADIPEVDEIELERTNGHLATV
jgi:hypothetical protein